MPLISIIIPCFDEAGNIDPLYLELTNACSGLDLDIVFVNDGSTDETALKIKRLQRHDQRISLISFITNSGHQIALRTGIRHAKGDYVVMLDADLQHPPGLIPEMVRRAEEGYDVVSMVHRPHPGVLKNTFSALFYWFFSIASGVAIQPNTSDFRLISRRVQQVVSELPERHQFLRGLLPSLGFATFYLTYDVRQRHSGKSKYTFLKSFSMAVDALFTFSRFPMIFFVYLGAFFAGSTALYAAAQVGLRFFLNVRLPASTDMVASVLFLGGLMLMLLAIMGRRLQTVLEQLKGRTEYFIDAPDRDTPHH